MRIMCVACNMNCEFETWDKEVIDYRDIDDYEIYDVWCPYWKNDTKIEVIREEGDDEDEEEGDEWMEM